MQLFGLFLNIIAFIVNIPFWIPFSSFVWAGIVIFNFKLFPWWVLILLLFWSSVCGRAVPESTNEIKKQMAENGYTPTTSIQVIILKLLQYPIFLAAVYALRKIT